MVKKIRTATITFHNSVNYGAILQTYALQKSILKLGFYNEIINYSPDSDKNLVINTTNLKSIIRSLINLPDFYVKKKKFDDFIKKRINITKKVSKNFLKSRDFNNEYDIFITGSDQVWNYELTNDSTYMLDFVLENNKKRSYAASFGISEIPNNLNSWYKNLLKNFHSILLREESGQKIIKQLLNREAKIVLDPVFLLNRKEWNNIIGKTKFEKIKNQYILIYYTTPQIIEFAKILSKRYGLSNIFIEALSFRLSRIGKVERTLGPEEFVDAIKNARFVLTGSFHAMVFSIIYNKEFFIDIIKNGRNSRLEQVLKMCNISNRYVEENIDQIMMKKINWDEVNIMIEKKVKESRNELFEMLKL